VANRNGTVPFLFEVVRERFRNPGRRWPKESRDAE
jgi:hypothetical protein